MEFFNKFNKDLLTSAEKKLVAHDKNFNELIDELIASLKKLKESYQKKSFNEFRNLKNKISLIQNCILFFSQEIEKNDTLHINKLFQLRKFFEIKSKKKIIVENFKIKTDNNKFLKEIRQILSGINEDKRIIENFGEKLLDIVANNSDSSDALSNNLNENCFHSDPLKLFQKEPILIEKETFIHIMENPIFLLRL